MRTRGWGGEPPASDEEAAQRILSAAKTAIDRDGDINIADIARAVGVTRQTVYRYFPSTDALLVAAAMDSASGFLDHLAGHLDGITDPATAIVEGVAYTLESLPGDRYMRLLLAPGHTGTFSATVTSDTALELARSILRQVQRRLGRRGFHRRRPRRRRRTHAAHSAVIRHRPGPTAAHRAGAPRLSAPLGRRGDQAPPPF